LENSKGKKEHYKEQAGKILTGLPYPLAARPCTKGDSTSIQKKGKEKDWGRVDSEVIRQGHHYALLGQANQTGRESGVLGLFGLEEWFHLRLAPIQLMLTLAGKGRWISERTSDGGSRISQHLTKSLSEKGDQARVPQFDVWLHPKE